MVWVSWVRFCGCVVERLLYNHLIHSAITLRRTYSSNIRKQDPVLKASRDDAAELLSLL